MLKGILDSNIKIVTSGLVLNLDTSQRRSYPSGATTWTDLSGNGNNISLVTFYGAAVPTYSTSNGGYFNLYNADWFNTVYGQATLSTSLKPTAITIETWVYIGTVPVSSNETIISVQKGTSEVYSYMMQYIDGRLGSKVTATGGADATPSGGNPTIVATSWYQALMTYDKTTLRMYVNGIERATSTTASGDITYDASNTKIIIGARYAGAGYDTGLTSYWGNARPDRGISIVRMYNRALTATEVSQNFNVMRLRFNL